ncbi:MAG: protease modulator HflC [Steroidobacteraceae bacterium]
MSTRAIGILIGVAAFILLASTCVFTVDEAQVAIRTQFSNIVGNNYGPGLHFKTPVDKIYRFERRIVTQNYKGETFLTSENKGLIVDFYIKWQVADVGLYYQSFAGDEDNAGRRLSEIVKDGIKGVVAQRTLQEIVIAERAAFKGEMFGHSSQKAQEVGIHLVDVRVQRIDLPDEVSGSVYQRMQESFRALANRLRAEGSAEAERIRAESDRKRTEILAEATQKAQTISGEGEATAAGIHARAYNKAPEFYGFYRSLQAYRNALGKEGDVLVVAPEGEFFKYMNAPGKR